MIEENNCKKILRVLSLVLYYGLATWLPTAYSPLGLGLSKPFRAILCKCIFRKCGQDVNIERHAYFGYGSNIVIGDHSGIGVSARIMGGGEVFIGDNVMMGPDVVILTLDHNFDNTAVPMNTQGYLISPVTIEDDVWIGMRALIVPGVKIGKGSIVAAGSVVTKDISPYTIVGGNPARVIRKRANMPSNVQQ